MNDFGSFMISYTDGGKDDTHFFIIRIFKQSAGRLLVPT